MSDYFNRDGNNQFGRINGEMSYSQGFVSPLPKSDVITIFPARINASTTGTTCTVTGLTAALENVPLGKTAHIFWHPDLSSEEMQRAEDILSKTNVKYNFRPYVVK